MLIKQEQKYFKAQERSNLPGLEVDDDQEDA